MAEIKTGIFAKNVQKRLNRAQEKVGGRWKRRMVEEDDGGGWWWRMVVVDEGLIEHDHISHVVYATIKAEIPSESFMIL